MNNQQKIFLIKKGDAVMEKGKVTNVQSIPGTSEYATAQKRRETERKMLIHLQNKEKAMELAVSIPNGDRSSGMSLPNGANKDNAWRSNNAVSNNNSLRDNPERGPRPMYIEDRVNTKYIKLPVLRHIDEDSLCFRVHINDAMFGGFGISISPNDEKFIAFKKAWVIGEIQRLRLLPSDSILTFNCGSKVLMPVHVIHLLHMTKSKNNAHEYCGECYICLFNTVFEVNDRSTNKLSFDDSFWNMCGKRASENICDFFDYVLSQIMSNNKFTLDDKHRIETAVASHAVIVDYIYRAFGRRLSMMKYVPEPFAIRQGNVDVKHYMIKKWTCDYDMLANVFRASMDELCHVLPIVGCYGVTLMVTLGGKQYGNGDVIHQSLSIHPVEQPFWIPGTMIQEQNSKKMKLDVKLFINDVFSISYITAVMHDLSSKINARILKGHPILAKYEGYSTRLVFDVPPHVKPISDEEIFDIFIQAKKDFKNIKLEICSTVLTQYKYNQIINANAAEIIFNAVFTGKNNFLISPTTILRSVDVIDVHVKRNMSSTKHTLIADSVIGFDEDQLAAAMLLRDEH